MPEEIKKRDTTPHFPELEVQLSGEDGNAYAIMGRVTKAMRRYGIRQKDIDTFKAEATSGDYDHLIATCGKWVGVS